MLLFSIMFQVQGTTNNCTVYVHTLEAVDFHRSRIAVVAIRIIYFIFTLFSLYVLFTNLNPGQMAGNIKTIKVN